MKTHIQIDTIVKKELEEIRDAHELASLSAAIRLLLKKCGKNLKETR